MGDIGKDIDKFAVKKKMALDEDFDAFDKSTENFFDKAKKKTSF